MRRSHRKALGPVRYVPGPQGKLYAARMALGDSQSLVADVLRVSIGTVSRIERCQTPASLDVLCRIEGYLLLAEERGHALECHAPHRPDED